MKRFIIFLILLVLFSAPFWFLSREHGFLYTTLLMFAPATAAVATIARTGGDLTTLGWRGCRWRWIVLGWAIPVVSIAAISMGAILAGAASFPDATALTERATKMGTGAAPQGVTVAILALLGFTAGIVSMSATAVGEEVGWRGFLAPELGERWGYASSSAAVGLIWAAWHFPLFLGLMPWISLLAFVLMILAFAFILGWLRAVSGSVWPAVIAHGTHNAVFAQFWDKLMVAPENSIWSGEASFSLAAVYALVAWGLWTAKRPASATPYRQAATSPA